MKAWLLIFACVATFEQGVFAQGGDEIVGTWLNSTGRAHIKIFKSGEHYYGNIAWLQNPNDEHGNPKLDKENPDPSLRNRKLVGLLILKAFKYDPANKSWVDGEIYDPKSGKTYSCKMQMKDSTHLEVRGYLGISLIGRTETWTKLAEK